jgi:hypothetical protein
LRLRRPGPPWARCWVVGVEAHLQTTIKRLLPRRRELCSLVDPLKFCAVGTQECKKAVLHGTALIPTPREDRVYLAPLVCQRPKDYIVGT